MKKGTEINGHYFIGFRFPKTCKHCKGILIRNDKRCRPPSIYTFETDKALFEFEKISDIQFCKSGNDVTP